MGAQGGGEALHAGEARRPAEDGLSSAPRRLYRPLADPAFFAGGFLETVLGFSRPGIERQLGQWRRFVYGTFGLVALEMWGRLYLMGETIEALDARIAGLEAGAGLAQRRLMSSISRQAARGTLFLGVAHASLTAAGYVVAVLLARGLGPVDYGVYGIVYSILMTIEVIARIGIPQAVSRLIAEAGDRAPRMAATGVTLTFGVYLVVFAIFWIAAPALADIFNVPNGAWLFRIAAIDIPFYGGYIIAAHILNGRRTFGPEERGRAALQPGQGRGHHDRIPARCHGRPRPSRQRPLLGVAFAWAAWAGGRAGPASFRPSPTAGR